MEGTTQDKLVAAAISLFALKGYAAVSIREIAKAADVNVSSVSYYFRGKEGLYRAILREHAEAVAAAVFAGDSLSPEARLRHYAKAVCTIHAQRPFVTRFLLSELLNPTSALDIGLKKKTFSFFSFLTKALEDGIDSGCFRNDLNVRHAAFSLAGILSFYFIAKPVFAESLASSNETDADYVEQAVAIYLAGVRKN